jgi:hypothetical protein
VHYGPRHADDQRNSGAASSVRLEGAECAVFEMSYREGLQDDISDAIHQQLQANHVIVMCAEIDAQFMRFSVLLRHSQCCTEPEFRDWVFVRKFIGAASRR